MLNRWFLPVGLMVSIVGGTLLPQGVPPVLAANEAAMLPVIALLLDQPSVRLSHAEATGGTVITIEHPTIATGGDLPVVVTSPEGRRIEMTAIVVETGRALLSLPVFLAADGNGFARGEAVIELPGGQESRVTIVDPAPLDDIPTGQVVQEFLQHIIASYADAKTGLDARDPDIGFEPDNLPDLIDVQSAQINALLSDWLASGLLYLPAPDGGSFAVPETTVKMLDRVLFSLVSGAADAVDALEPQVFAYEAANNIDLDVIETHLAEIRATAARLESLVYGGEEFDRVRRTIRIATGTLISQIREGLSHLDNIPGPLDDAANLGLDLIEAIHRILIDGVLTDFVRAMGQDRYGVPDRPYGETGQVMRDIITENIENRLPPGADFIREAFRGDYHQMAKIAERYCASAVRPLDLERYCRIIDDNSGKVVYPSVAAIAAIPRSVLSGQAVNLRTWVSGWLTGASYSKNNILRIDWGDGSAVTTLDYVMGEGAVDQSHVYTLPQAEYEEMSFTISVTVEGSSEPFAGSPSAPRTARVTVRSEIPPFSVACDQAPDGALQVNESGTWTWRVSGGEPPYNVELDWGDGSPKRMIRQTELIAYWSTHAYRSEGLFDISLKVTDANDVVDSCDSFQFVGELPQVTVGATDASATEGAGDATFSIYRTGALDEELLVDFSLSGTASGDDYASSHAGSIVFPVAANTVDVRISAHWDVFPEGVEYLELHLNEPVGFDYELGEPDWAEVSINDPFVHICDDPDYPYTHSGTQCARFWGCSGSTFVKNGNVFCWSNSYWILTGGSIDKYSCDDSYYQNCSLWESQEVTRIDPRENGFTIVVDDGASWYPLDEIE